MAEASDSKPFVQGSRPSLGTAELSDDITELFHENTQYSTFNTQMYGR